VSSEMAKRMDDSNSTRSLARREPERNCIPWVEMVMKSQCVNKARGEKKGVSGQTRTRPPVMRFFMMGSIPALDRRIVPPNINESLYPGKCWGRWRHSAQTSDVVGHRTNFFVGHVGRNLGHLRTVLASATTELVHLVQGVLGMLAGQTGILRWNT